jgi:hypothetical protein
VYITLAMVEVYLSILVVALLLNFVLITYLIMKSGVDILHVLALPTSLIGVCLPNHIILVIGDARFLRK